MNLYKLIFATLILMCLCINGNAQNGSFLSGEKSKPYINYLIQHDELIKDYIKDTAEANEMVASYAYWTIEQYNKLRLENVGVILIHMVNPIKKINSLGFIDSFFNYFRIESAYQQWYFYQKNTNSINIFGCYLNNRLGEGFSGIQYDAELNKRYYANDNAKLYYVIINVFANNRLFVVKDNHLFQLKDGKLLSAKERFIADPTFIELINKKVPD